VEVLRVKGYPTRSEPVAFRPHRLVCIPAIYYDSLYGTQQRTRAISEATRSE